MSRNQERRSPLIGAASSRVCCNKLASTRRSGFGGGASCDAVVGPQVNTLVGSDYGIPHSFSSLRSDTCCCGTPRRATNLFLVSQTFNGLKCLGPCESQIGNARTSNAVALSRRTTWVFCGSLRCVRLTTGPQRTNNTKCGAK
jgi:hypothetical protein